MRDAQKTQRKRKVLVQMWDILQELLSKLLKKKGARHDSFERFAVAIRDKRSDKEPQSS